MFRIVLAVVTALALSACGPSAKVDPAKPWDTLLPWNHSFSGIQKLPSGVEYIVVRKGDGETLGRLNKAIDTIKANGTLQAIVQKWGV